MDICQGLKKLPEESLDQLFVEQCLARIQVNLQILFQVLHNQKETVLTVNDFEYSAASKELEKKPEVNDSIWVF